jgi:hypothetical protein
MFKTCHFLFYVHLAVMMLLTVREMIIGETIVERLKYLLDFVRIGQLARVLQIDLARLHVSQMSF